MAQPTPRFTTLADGRGVKIESSFGTDYALLGLDSFRLQADGLEFDGKAGAVQVRPTGARVSLPCRGKIGYQGKSLEHAGNSVATVSR